MGENGVFHWPSMTPQQRNLVNGKEIVGVNTLCGFYIVEGVNVTRYV